MVAQCKEMLRSKVVGLTAAERLFKCKWDSADGSLEVLDDEDSDEELGEEEDPEGGVEVPGLPEGL